MPLFDVYISVDFSGSNDPARQRCGIAFAEWDRSISPDVRMGFTRSEVTLYVLERIIHHDSNGKRVLCGFDFQYSFPQGFWRALTGLPETWTNILQGMANGVADLPAVVEEPKSNARLWADMANQRIARVMEVRSGPFWGPNFSPAKDPKFLHTRFEKLRLVEKRDRRFKQPIFKIGGRGAVGLQSLCGIPHLFFLRNSCMLKQIMLHCWPFDGWDPVGSTHFLVEWFPAIQNKGRKGDKEDALACVKWAKAKDDQGELSKYLTPRLSDIDKAQVASEGWVLGIL